jgi:hypothetical protein
MHCLATLQVWTEQQLGLDNEMHWLVSDFGIRQEIHGYFDLLPPLKTGLEHYMTKM